MAGDAALRPSYPAGPLSWRRIPDLNEEPCTTLLKTLIVDSTLTSLS